MILRVFLIVLLLWLGTAVMATQRKGQTPKVRVDWCEHEPGARLRKGQAPNDPDVCVARSSGAAVGCPRNCVGTPFEAPTTCVSNGTQTPCRVALSKVLLQNAQNLDKIDSLEEARDVVRRLLTVDNQQHTTWTLLTSVHVGLDQLRAAHTAHIVAFMLGGRLLEAEHMSLCEQLAEAGSEYLYLARDCYLVVATSQVTTPALAVQASAKSRKLSYRLQAQNRPEFDDAPPPLLERGESSGALVGGDCAETDAEAGTCAVAGGRDPLNGVSMLPTIHKAGMLAQYRVHERSVLHFHVMKTGGTTLCKMALENNQFNQQYLERWGTPLQRNCILDMPQLRALRPSKEFFVHEKPPNAVTPFFFSDEFLAHGAREMWPRLGTGFSSWEPASESSDWSLDPEWWRMTEAGPGQ